MSEDKREIQKRNRELAQQKARIASSIKWAVIGILAIAIIGLIGWAVASSFVSTTKQISDFSAGLNEDGTIEGVRALDYVELCDYKNITVSRSELEPTDEEVKEYIQNILDAYPTLNTETTAKVKKDDMINLDYVGSIGGVEFQGGNTNGNGTQLVIGSNTYIPGFEDQIIGHVIGEEFDVIVTFPEDYYNTDLAGQDAVFKTVVNGIYEDAKFDDEFVSAHLANYAVTADGFIKYYKNAVFDQKLAEYVSGIIVNDTKVTGYPDKFMKILKGQIAYSDQANFEAGGQTGEAYKANGMTKKEYEASLTVQAQKQIEPMLKIQAICEDADLHVTSEDVTAFFAASGLDSSYYNSYENTYGKGYIYNAGMAYTVVEYVKSQVTITD